MPAHPDPQEYDIIITGAEVPARWGGPARPAALAIQGERFPALGDGAHWPARLRLDATGKVVSPGFIDCHPHDARALLGTPLMRPKVSQGITTVVTGNCGISLAPVRTPGDVVPPPLNLLAKHTGELYARMQDYADALSAAPAAVNSLALVGHSSLRISAMDRLDRPADKGEIATMRRALDEAMAAGAAGLSTGLYYPTAMHASTEEVIGVAEPLKAWRGLYTTHLRDEADHVCDAMEEAFLIGRAADVPAILSHHKVTGKHNHGRTAQTLALFDRVRADQPVGMDVYPYAASSTILEPRRVAAGEKIIVTWSQTRPEIQGVDLRELAAREGKDPTCLAEELSPGGAIYFSMDEADVKRVIGHGSVMIGSDGLPHDQRPHPRLWGAFSRVLARYVREMRVLGLEEAVRRMTSLTAAQFGLKDRGVLRAGCYADVVVFDATTVADLASFAEPTLPSTGIHAVLVNGQVVEENGAPTGARPGRLLRGDERAAPGFETPAWAACNASAT
ncbi:N-acyl-D-amino-acid deacylase family protein [Achromobacter spanius]|uniref:N-acyl-D-amino-acid deacylase family protein n=1 Tax=Achromobacter spanius TaxID=217203 RepID=UPI003A95C40B